MMDMQYSSVVLLAGGGLALGATPDGATHAYMVEGDSIIGFRSDIDARFAFPEATPPKEAPDYDKYVTGFYWKRHDIPAQKATNDTVQTIIGFDKKPGATVRDALQGLPSMGG